MTVVAQGNNWWIESFDVPRATVLSATVRQTALTLERVGVFLGGSATFDLDLAVNDANITLAIRNSDDTVLVIGQDLSAFECVMINNEGANRTCGAHVIIFMRKP